MIGTNELDDVVRMTGVAIAIGNSRRVVLSSMRLRIAMIVTVIVSEHDAHAVAIVGNTHGMFATRSCEQNRDTRNDVVPGPEETQVA